MLKTVSATLQIKIKDMAKGAMDFLYIPLYIPCLTQTAICIKSLPNFKWSDQTEKITKCWKTFTTNESFNSGRLKPLFSKH